MSETNEKELMLPQVVYEEVKDFKKDSLFKYTTDAPEENEDSHYLLEGIVEGAVGEIPEQIVEMDTELSPEDKADKTMRTDRLYDLGELGILNLEMQNSEYSKNNNVRFQKYHSKLAAIDNHRGDKNYGDKARKIHQVIMINAVKKEWQQLVKRFTLRSEEGDEFPDNLMYIYIVQIPYINEIAKEKPLEEFDRLEMYTYVLANGEEDDIMEINHRVVEIMERKRNEYNANEILKAFEYNRQMKEEIVRDEGMAIGEAKGKVEGKAEGIEEGVYKNQRQLTMKIFQMKYPNIDATLISDLTLEQYQNIFDLLLQDAPFEEIEAIIH